MDTLAERERARKQEAEARAVRIIALYRAGYKPPKIGKMIGTTGAYVRKILRAAGPVDRPKRRRRQDHWAGYDPTTG